MSRSNKGSGDEAHSVFGLGGDPGSERAESPHVHFDIPPEAPTPPLHHLAPPFPVFPESRHQQPGRHGRGHHGQRPHEPSLPGRSAHGPIHQPGSRQHGIARHNPSQPWMSPRVANIGRLVAEEIGPVEGARFAYLLAEDEGDIPPSYLRPSPFGPMPFPSGFGPPPRLSSRHTPHHGRRDHDHHHQRQYAGGPGMGTGPRGLPPGFVPRPPNEREFAEITAAFHCTPQVAARLVREGNVVFATDGRSLYDARLEGRLQRVRRLRVMGRMAG